jgi:hypothetical protein
MKLRLLLSAAAAAICLAAPAFAQRGEVGLPDYDRSDRDLRTSMDFSGSDPADRPSRDSFDREGSRDNPGGAKGIAAFKYYGEGGNGLPFKARSDGRKHHMGRKAFVYRADGTVTRFASDQYGVVTKWDSGATNHHGWDNDYSFEDLVRLEVEYSDGYAVEAGTGKVIFETPTAKSRREAEARRRQENRARVQKQNEFRQRNHIMDGAGGWGGKQ